ncbi:hypothetical protein EON63_17500 [archaeon]|nr:MAG: hypothetical protein EON63_17500 [archaeon]
MVDSNRIALFSCLAIPTHSLHTQLKLVNHTHTYTYTHNTPYTHTHIYTYTHIYIHTCITQASLNSPIPPDNPA